ncbi:MAG: hypothetical protein KF779_08915 [Hyphomonadaceae bacterium]|nr:hypothetical protein [Hyphomonadaceae bacterium]
MRSATIVQVLYAPAQVARDDADENTHEERLYWRHARANRKPCRRSADDNYGRPTHQADRNPVAGIYQHSSDQGGEGDH